MYLIALWMIYKKFGFVQITKAHPGHATNIIPYNKEKPYTSKVMFLLCKIMLGIM